MPTVAAHAGVPFGSASAETDSVGEGVSGNILLGVVWIIKMPVISTIQIIINVIHCQLHIINRDKIKVLHYIYTNQLFTFFINNAILELIEGVTAQNVVSLR